MGVGLTKRDRSKAGLALAKLQEEKRNRQFDEVLAYCKKHRVRGYAALNQNKNRWPDITRNTIDQRLDGDVKHRELWQNKETLTAIERNDLATSMREGAKSGNPFRYGDRNAAVLDMLEWRSHTNKGGGRKFVKLSKAARALLRSKKVYSTRATRGCMHVLRICCMFSSHFQFHCVCCRFHCSLLLHRRVRTGHCLR